MCRKLNKAFFRKQDFKNIWVTLKAAKAQFRFFPNKSLNINYDADFKKSIWYTNFNILKLGNGISHLSRIILKIVGLGIFIVKAFSND